MKMKRLLAGVLAVCMLISAVPMYSLKAMAREEHFVLPADEVFPVTPEEEAAHQKAVEEGLVTPQATVDISEEIPALLWAVEEVKTALLNGKTSVSLAELPFGYNNYQFHHLSYYCPYTDGSNISLSLYSYSDGSYSYIRIQNNLSAQETREWITLIDRKVAELEALIADPALSEEEQVLILHDYMVSHYHYDTSYQNIYPSQMLTQKSGVCQSYAYLFQYLMNKKNIPCYYTSSSSMNHGWNIIRLNDNYFQLDITWDDPTPDRLGQVRHDYYLVSDSVISDSSHNHSGWDLTQLTCSTSISDLYFASATSPVVFDGNDRYYIQDNTLYKYNKNTKTTEAAASLGKWYVFGNPNSYWTGSFSGLIKDGTRLFYNTYNAIMVYDLSTGVSSVYETVDTTAGYVYGCVAEENTIYYAIQQNYNVQYPNKTIRSLNYSATHVHEYSATVTKEASCEETGIRTYICTGCHDSYTETIPATGHSVVSDAAIPATCTVDGITAGSHCSVCGKPLVTQNIVPAKGHAVVNDAAIPATCTVDGISAGSHCSVCGDILKEQYIVPAKGHAVVNDAAIPATCTVDGITAGSHCSACGDILTAQKEIPATGHSYGEKQYLNESYHVSYCSSCGGEKKEAHYGGTASEEAGPVCEGCLAEYNKELPPRALVEDTFKDIKQTDWYRDAVQYVYDHGIMSGTNGGTTFEPLKPLVRAQFAIVLYQLEGSPAVSYTPRFKDVPNGTWFTDAVMWASDAKVVTGFSDGTFRYANKITREQMAIMMYQYAKYKGYDISASVDIDGFKDANQVNSWAKAPVQWAVANGIISGKDSGTRLDPQGSATRAECAVIMMKFILKFGK